MARTVPVQDAEPGDLRVLLRALEKQLQADADPEEGPAVVHTAPHDLVEPRVAKSPGAGAEGPDPGRTTPRAPDGVLGAVDEAGVGADVRRAFSAERRFPMP